MKTKGYVPLTPDFLTFSFEKSLGHVFETFAGSPYKVFGNFTYTSYVS
jgi:hypothetical protein